MARATSVRLALAACLLLTAGPVIAAQAGAAEVRVASGFVVGQTQGPARVFRAIPYAAPPLGALRWAPPAPVPRWSGERLAVSPGPACMQKVDPAGGFNLGGYRGPVSEDCLTLDVTAPLAGRRLPVMVWVFGGGNIAGATDLPSYDARNFARDGVIVVAMNYRLGPLGFFAHPALTRAAARGQPLLNYGLMDQIAALKWVRRNIAAFGGDPANVTIFGESAGGSDVLALMTIASAGGLFQKAIVQSGGGWDEPVYADNALERRESAGAALASRVGLPGTAASVEQLRAVPASSLIAAAESDLGLAVDGRLIREPPTRAFARGEAAAVPLIIGSDSNEASLMRAIGVSPAAIIARARPAVRAAYAADGSDEATLARQLFNDMAMGAPARWIAGRQARRAPTWLYYFSYVPERQRATRSGTNHASEIPFVFDSIDAIPGRALLATPSERAVAALAHSCWVAFARSGRPTCAAGQAWPAYSARTDRLLEFGDPSRVRSHFRKAQLDAQEAAATDRLAP